MKQATIIIASLFMSFFVLSCGDTSKEKPEDQQKETVNQEETDHHVKSEGFELNNGEKWLVNSEMKPFVAKGEKLINEYIANNNTEYKALAAQLKEQNSQLISSCTMDGKSHEVLHEWLHPHLEIVKELSSAETNEVANEIVVRLKTSYGMYHQYFQ
ncbi:MAG: hypothetical protein HQ522_15105 [Bacteroidetes bacterium]|nr:hypothetical protein [Bacteroidota bacterium]